MYISRTFCFSFFRTFVDTRRRVLVTGVFFQTWKSLPFIFQLLTIKMYECFFKYLLLNVPHRRRQPERAGFRGWPLLSLLEKDCSSISNCTQWYLHVFFIPCSQFIGPSWTTRGRSSSGFSTTVACFFILLSSTFSLSEKKNESKI